eukprot:15477561-Alexandrium_andersonii.AAC.1
MLQPRIPSLPIAFAGVVPGASSCCKTCRQGACHPADPLWGCRDSDHGCVWQSVADHDLQHAGA